MIIFGIVSSHKVVPLWWVGSFAAHRVSSLIKVSDNKLISTKEVRSLKVLEHIFPQELINI